MLNLPKNWSATPCSLLGSGHFVGCSHCHDDKSKQASKQASRPDSNAPKMTHDPGVPFEPLSSDAISTVPPPS